jgi:mono/diheme cytochrome c family protein
MKRTVTVGCLLTLWAAFASAGQLGEKSPPAYLIESISGQDSFMFYCAPCHGRSGMGDGPVGAALKRTPPDLTVLARRNGGTFPKGDVLSFVTGTARPLPAHGSSDMPVWGPIFRSLDPSDTRTKVRIENIVAFVESIQVK